MLWAACGEGHVANEPRAAPVNSKILKPSTWLSWGTWSCPGPREIGSGSSLSWVPDETTESTSFSIAALQNTQFSHVWTCDPWKLCFVSKVYVLVFLQPQVTNNSNRFLHTASLLRFPVILWLISYYLLPSEAHPSQPLSVGLTPLLGTRLGQCVFQENSSSPAKFCEACSFPRVNSSLERHFAFTTASLLTLLQDNPQDNFWSLEFLQVSVRQKSVLLGTQRDMY